MSLHPVIRLLLIAIAVVMLFPHATSATTPAPAYPYCLLVGEWENQTPSNNKFHIRIDWDILEGKFKGYLTQQGELSQFVGFTLGEYIYEAPGPNSQGIINEQAKWRYGSNGISTGAEWRTYAVNPASWTSPDQGVFYTGGLLNRLGSASPSCAPNPTSPVPAPAYPYCLLIGEWENQTPNNNKFHIRIDWDILEGKFKGYLTQQGELSQFVGFTLGEYIYEAPGPNSQGIINEQAKWRYGSNGISTGAEWRTYAVNPASWTSPDQGVFYTGGLLNRIGRSTTSCPRSTIFLPNIIYAQ